MARTGIDDWDGHMLSQIAHYQALPFGAEASLLVLIDMCGVATDSDSIPPNNWLASNLKEREGGVGISLQHLPDQRSFETHCPIPSQTPPPRECLFAHQLLQRCAHTVDTVRATRTERDDGAGQQSAPDCALA